MIIGIGTDLLEINRIKKNYEKFSHKFLLKVFTQAEIKLCESVTSYEKKIAKYASRFTAKEATVKALGIGFSKGISLLDIEVLNDSLGKPTINLSNKALDFAKSLCITKTDLRFHVSITDTEFLVQAFVVIESIGKLEK